MDYQWNTIQGIREWSRGDSMKRGERRDGSIVKHCGVTIASKWNYCPMCGAKKQTKVIEWVKV